MALYAQPHSLDDALRLRSEGGWTIVAGGTDFYPARADRPIVENVLDISRVAGLQRIEEFDDHFRIGALVTWSQLLSTPLPPEFNALKLASCEVGGVQIQNRGTIAGNICNASPAADGVPALLALDARVEVQSHEKPAVQIELISFIVAAKKTQISNAALVTAIIVPKTAHRAVSTFLKTGARRYLLISTAMVAVYLAHERGLIRSARVAIGACSPVSRRIVSLETRLLGQTFDRSLSSHVRSGDFAVLSPIDDVRADAAYRFDIAETLTRRALTQLAQTAGAAHD